MKFAKANITRQGPPRLLDASASSQKGRGSDFRYYSRDPDPVHATVRRSNTTMQLQSRDVAKLWS